MAAPSSPARIEARRALQAKPRPKPGRAPRWRGCRGSPAGCRTPGARGPRGWGSGAGLGLPCALSRGEGRRRAVLTLLRRPARAPSARAPRGSERGALWTGRGRARTAAARASGMLMQPPAATPGGPARDPRPTAAAAARSRVTPAPTSRARLFVRTQRRTLIFFFPRSRLHTRPISPPPSHPPPHTRLAENRLLCAHPLGLPC